MLLKLIINKNKLKNFKQDITSESPLRSIIKSFTWRAVGTLDTITISYIVTGKGTYALTIGSFEFFTKMILYFLHERVWNKIKWGK